MVAIYTRRFRDTSRDNTENGYIRKDPVSEVACPTELQGAFEWMLLVVDIEGSSIDKNKGTASDIKTSF